MFFVCNNHTEYVKIDRKDPSLFSDFLSLCVLVEVYENMSICKTEVVKSVSKSIIFIW